MNRSLKWLTALLVAGALSACYDTGWSGGRTTIAASYGTGFYRPFGYNYGTWGNNYWVGPPRRFGGRTAMRPGWGPRGAPTIPMRPRGGPPRRFGGRGRRF